MQLVERNSLNAIRPFKCRIVAFVGACEFVILRISKISPGFIPTKVVSEAATVVGTTSSIASIIMQA